MATPVIRYGGWLTFNDRGTARFSKGKPTVGRDERTMRIEVSLPKALFTVPTLAATIIVDHDSIEPPAINIELAATALRGVLGVDIDLQVKGPTE